MNTNATVAPNLRHPRFGTAPDSSCVGVGRRSLSGIRGTAVVSAYGEIGPTLSAQSAVGATSSESASVAAGHSRDLSAPAAPVARTQAHLLRSGVTVRRRGDRVLRRGIFPDAHGSAIGSTVRELKISFKPNGRRR
jgi:hypothetical protein